MSFEGWADGERVVLRALRRGLERDPVWRRRLERGASHLPGPQLLAPTAFVAEPWPHLRIPLRGPSLADLLPVEDRPDTLVLARFLAGGLAGLERLHDLGLVHGGVTPDHLVQGPDGVRLAWVDPLIDGPREPAQDLAELGATVAMLDPEGVDPVGDLARAMADEAPPNAVFASALLVRTLSAELAERRHRLAMRSRMLRRSAEEARLLRAVRRLEHSIPPPRGIFCLRAGHDQVLVVADCDGERIRGGPVAGLPARFLPTVWSRQGGLEPTGTRALLRAWATRQRGDEERRAVQAAALGHDDEQAQGLCRWLSAQSRLRSVRMLLELSA